MKTIKGLRSRGLRSKWCFSLNLRAYTLYLKPLLFLLLFLIGACGGGGDDTTQEGSESCTPAIVCEGIGGSICDSVTAGCRVDGCVDCSTGTLTPGSSINPLEDETGESTVVTECTAENICAVMGDDATPGVEACFGSIVSNSSINGVNYKLDCPAPNCVTCP